MSKDNLQLEGGYVRINNELYEALYKADFSASELRIIHFIIRQTYGYNCNTKYLTASCIANGTEISYNTVIKVIPKLKKSKVLNEVLINGKIEIGINKYYRKWQCQKRQTLAENGSIILPKTAISPCQKRQTDLAENGKHINTIYKDNIKDNVKDSGKPSPFKGEASAELPQIAKDLGYTDIEEWRRFKNQ